MSNPTSSRPNLRPQPKDFASLAGFRTALAQHARTALKNKPRPPPLARLAYQVTDFEGDPVIYYDADLAEYVRAKPATPAEVFVLDRSRYEEIHYLLYQRAHKAGIKEPFVWATEYLAALGIVPPKSGPSSAA